MGTYGLTAKDIQTIFEQLEFESHCEGDFSEENFIEGARLYLESLREIGMDCPREPKKHTLSRLNPTHETFHNCGGIFNQTDEDGMITCNKCGETLLTYFDELADIF